MSAWLTLSAVLRQPRVDALHLNLLGSKPQGLNPHRLGGNPQCLKIIALGALAVSLIAPLAMHATPTTTPSSSTRMGGWLTSVCCLQRLIDVVAAANVAVVKADETFAFCDQPGFTTYAGYNATINVIVICTNNAPPQRIAASFTHEAVHLAQDCKAGIANADLMTSTCT